MKDLIEKQSMGAMGLWGRNEDTGPNKLVSSIRCCTSLTAGGTRPSTWTPASSSPPSSAEPPPPHHCCMMSHSTCNVFKETQDEMSSYFKQNETNYKDRINNIPDS